MNPKIHFQINPNSGVPIYRQIIDQVKMGITTGKFKPGDYLPSVREVSSSIDINPMTVSKAYSLLEKGKNVEFVRGQGMRIPDGPIPSDHFIGQQQMKWHLKEVVNYAKGLSLDQKSVVNILKKTWGENNHE